MSLRGISTIVGVVVALVTLASCGNTIRGVGRDVGNVVDATQDAGRSVVNSVD